MRLFHASRKYFETPDLSKSSDLKDFGRGYYLTTSLEQAEDWAIRGLPENKKDTFGYIYEYGFDMNNTEKLNCKKLLLYDKEWLDFVAWHRNNIEQTIEYDLVYDRMADGKYAALTYMLNKYYMGRATAEETFALIKYKTDKYNQYCFKTETALTYLNRTSYAEVYNYRGRPHIIKWYKPRKDTGNG